MKVLVTVEVQFEMNKPLFCCVESSDGALCVVCSSMCGARSNHCELTAVHPHSVSVMAGQGSLCSRPFLAAVFMRRRCLCGCIWRDVDDVTEWKFIFLCKSMFVEHIEIYRWVLFMFACSALFSSTLLPLHRAADNVLCLCLERHHEAQRENLTQVLSLKTQFVTFASFKGAIVVSFFWAVNVSNIYFCGAERSTPVAYAVWTIQLIFGVNFSTTFIIQEQTLPKRTELGHCNWANTDPANHRDNVISPAPRPTEECWQAVQSTTELSVSVCSLFLFKFISVRSEPEMLI